MYSTLKILSPEEVDLLYERSLDYKGDNSFFEANEDELRELYNTYWKSTLTQFSKIYGLNNGNFSLWLNPERKKTFL